MDKAESRDVVVTPQRQATTTNSSTVRRPTAAGLGITTTKPKFPQYATVAKRLSSFNEQDWPNATPVTVDALTEAGLVYTGVGDSVRCYYCGGGLRNWEVGDDPMIEHARWYPTCPHVILVKGKTYITRISDGFEPEPEVDCAPPQGTGPVPFNVLHVPAVQAVIDVGYSQELVLKAVEVYKQQKGLTQCRTPAGLNGLNGQDLCRIIMDIEENPDEYRSITGTSSGSLMSNEADGPATIPEKPEVDMETLLEENRKLKESVACRICLDRRAEIIFLPCGHITACPQCAPALLKCPVCRKAINGLVKAYFATTCERVFDQN